MYMNNLSDPLLQLTNRENINKYKTAGKIASSVLDKLIDVTTIGTNVYDICKLSDALIMDEVYAVYTDIKFKGIAFPTSVSINNIAGYFSPLPNDKTVINNGDLVKLELGVHIDGFPALVVYTIFINENNENNVNAIINEKKSNVIKAVNEASKEILKNMKPGVTNCDIVKILEKCALKYKCNLPFVNESIDDIGSVAPGTLSHQMSRSVINGYNNDDDIFIHRFILSRNNENYGFQMSENTLEENEVYGIDIVMSSGVGKLVKVMEPTIFRKILYIDGQFNKVDLKLQASRATLNKFNTIFPITVRNIDDNKFRLGLKECINKGVLEPYTPFQEKEGEYIARAKFTVIVKNKPILVSGRSLDEQLVKLQ